MLVYFIYLVFITPAILIPCVYIIGIGTYCIFSLDTIIDVCEPFPRGHVVTYYMIQIVTHAVLICNVICMIALGKYGLRCLLHLTVMVLPKYQVNVFNTRCDYRFVRNYVVFVMPSLILQIETYWAVGKLEGLWYFAVSLSFSIISTSIVALVIFVIPMNNIKELLDKNYIDVSELNDSEKIDRYGEEQNDVLIDRIEGNNYFFCSTKSRRRYRWILIYCVNLFVYCSTFFVYDLMRVTMDDTEFVNKHFYRLYLFFSTMAITFRIFYANFYWTKILEERSLFIYSKEIVILCSKNREIKNMDFYDVISSVDENDYDNNDTN